jgi:hypothetical protein
MIAAGHLTRWNASRRDCLLLIEAEAGLDLLERVKLEREALDSNERHAMGFEWDHTAANVRLELSGAALHCFDVGTAP